MFQETLSKFGVPLGGGAGRGGILQPKVKYRYRVRFINFGPIAGGLDLSQNVMSCGVPSISHEPIEVHSYNSRAYFAGKHEWDSISVELRDDVTNTVNRLVGHQQQKQLNHYEQTGFLAGVNYKFTMIIEYMDGGNDGVLATWHLEGCYLSKVDRSELDYSQSESNTITLDIRYDNATMVDSFPMASGSGGIVSGGLGMITGDKIG